jgi:hypothetical protein
MTNFSTATIEQRVMAAIRPTLARADRALWELRTPKFWKGKHDPSHPRFETP